MRRGGDGNDPDACRLWGDPGGQENRIESAANVMGLIVVAPSARRLHTKRGVERAELEPGAVCGGDQTHPMLGREEPARIVQLAPGLRVPSGPFEGECEV